MFFKGLYRLMGDNLSKIIVILLNKSQNFCFLVTLVPYLFKMFDPCGRGCLCPDGKKTGPMITSCKLENICSQQVLFKLNILKKKIEMQ